MNLLLIGNKQEHPSYRGQELPLDLYIERINSMDYVCRVNRMMNYGTTTGTRVDGLYIGGWRDFDEVYHGGDHVDVMKTVPQIFVNFLCGHTSFCGMGKKYITEEQRNNMILCKFYPGKERMNYEYPVSSVSMIDYFCNEKPGCDEYNIGFTGLDVDNRGEIMKNGDPGKDGHHALGGDKEEAYLRKLMTEGRLHGLDKDIYEHLGL